MTRSSLDTLQWKQVSDFEMAICQNEAEAAEAIKGAKVHCGTTIRETETCCTADIRKGESCCAEHACYIQQFYAEDMQCLEMEAMEEDRRDHLSLLTACGAALQAYPWKPVGH